MDDAQAVSRDAPLVRDVAPEMTSSEQVEYGATNANLRVMGTTANYPEVNRFPLALGRFFTTEEDQGRRRVAVLGGAVPEVLDAEPVELVGRSIRIENVPFEVVGVLDEKGGTGWFNQDEVILVPLQTARFRIKGDDTIDRFNAAVTDPGAMSAAMAQIEQVLRRQHRLVYQVLEVERTVKVLRMWTHYE